MDYCENINFLRIVLFIKTLLKLITYILPIILIVIVMISFFKASAGNEKDYNVAFEKSIKKIIAAILVFLVPTIVNSVFNLVGNNSNNIFKCYSNANADVINKLEVENIHNLINVVKSSYEESDFVLARDAINKIKDEDVRNNLESELNELKEMVYYNKKIKELKYNVNQLKKNYSEEKYKNLYNEVQKLSDSNLKNELTNILKKAREEYLKSLGPVIEPLNVKAGVHENSDYDSEMRYIEVIPNGATTQMPLVIYFHGIWSYASFSNNAPNYLITKYVASGSAYTKGKFILIIPRVVLSEGNENNSVTWKTNQGKEQTKKVKGLIDFIVKKYSINKKKIYVTGVSLGGDGAWNMVEAYPNFFAASVPISGCAGSDPKIANYLKTPILAFHGTGYLEGAYMQCVPSICDKIKSAGGDIELRVKNGYSHGDMQKVYTESGEKVFEWMLSKERK